MDPNYRIPIKILDINAPPAEPPKPKYEPMDYYTEEPSVNRNRPPGTPSAATTTTSSNILVVCPSQKPDAAAATEGSSTTTTAPKRTATAAALDPTAKPSSAPSSSSSHNKAGDEPLPAELTKLFLPMLCQLCKVQSNSAVSARMHYDSKVHSKRITQWLLEWTERTGESMPKRAALFEGPTGPNALHCNTCDLALTSLLHAKQHYMGRKHKSVMMGNAYPRGSGHYDKDGKWIRTPIKPLYDPTGRFNIGIAFIKPTEPCTVGATTFDVPPADGHELLALPALPPPPSIVNRPADVYCAVCNIAVSAKTEMAKHLAGTKHAKKLKASGASPVPPAPEWPTAAGTAAGDTIARSVMQKAPAFGDISVYRTPTGKYYCRRCNLTIEDAHTFGQHLQSKKHARATSPKRDATTVSVAATTTTKATATAK